MRVEFEPGKDEYFTVRFPYDAGMVARIRSMRNRRWNKVRKCWEIHVSQLPRLLQMFGLANKDVNPKLMRAYHMFKLRNYKARIEAGNVHSRLMGTDLPIKKIDEATSCFLPGYQFMPRFIDGSWDGKRHLFDRRKQAFPTGLVARVQVILDAAKIDYQVMDTASEPQGSLSTTKPSLKPHKYQKACIEAALNGRRGIIEMATGGGKTAVAAWMIHELALPALFFVHTKDLLHQARDTFAEQLGVPVGQVGDGKVDIRPLTVAMVQSCARALGVKVEKEADGETIETDTTDVKDKAEEILAAIRTHPVIFFDECHHLPADTFFALAMETEGACHRYGLSATPYRSDRQDLLLEAALGPQLFRANASLLIEQGYLVPPKIQMIAAPAVKFTDKAPDYQLVYGTSIVDNDARHKLVATHAKRIAAKKQSVLILVSQVKHGENLQKVLPGAPLVQGTDASATRRKVFRALEKKEERIVIATTLADEGLDIPNLDALIIAGGGRSETRALQRVGRALRTAPGKKSAEVIDFFDNAPYLREHSLRRLEIYESEPAFKVETSGFKP